MVIRERDEGWFCIPQSQHAELSGQLARAWGNDRFPSPQPLEAVCVAAARHDDGMIEFDADPELDENTGLPRDFMRMPLDLWISCWRRGPSMVAAASPYAGLLVCLHGLHLLGYRRLDPGDTHGAEAIERFRSDQHELIADFRERAGSEEGVDPTGLEPEAVESNRALIALWDAISLALCMPRLPDSFEAAGSSNEPFTLSFAAAAGSGPGPVTVEVDPWPFASAEVSLTAAGRMLRRRHDDRESLRAELGSATVEVLEFRLAPRASRG